MARGKLYGVSVGPGDPELLTLKAVRVIEDADFVAVPDIGHKRRTAYSIAEGRIRGKQLLECQTPMTHDRDSLKAAYEAIADDICAKLDEGKTVAYLCLGDIGVYSTYMYVHRIVTARGYDTEIVPGVTSFSAAAAKLGTSLCEGPECLLVVPASAPDFEEMLDVRANKVLMKPGKDVGELRGQLAARGQLQGAAMVSNCGLEDERVFAHLADAGDETDYFSVIIVKDA